MWPWHEPFPALIQQHTVTLLSVPASRVPSPAGLKQGLGKLRRYLFITTDDTSPDGAASSQLHLLDVRNKLLAGSFSVQGLAAVVVGPGGLATWDKSGRLMRYFEVELSTQVRGWWCGLLK
jgi:hypothetical protein